MGTGSIKRLIRDRGFGFIRVEDGTDVFFHRSHCKDVSFDALEEGVTVEFEQADSDKGPRVAWVKVVGSEPEAGMDPGPAIQPDSPENRPTV